MTDKAFRSGFGIYFDPTKSTSGQRFFGDLYQALSAEAVSLSQGPAAILFNVSAPLKEIVKAKWARQRIVLRIDGLYFDRLSPAFVASFSWPLRIIFSIGLRRPQWHDFLAFWANLVNQNYGAFCRILLADFVIYQSKFSERVHSRYFPKKPYKIIVNGSRYRAEGTARRFCRSDCSIRLVTVYDDWKPAKRVHDLVKFVQWARLKRNVPVRLTILGYNGKLPVCAPTSLKTTIETSSFIRTLPKFKDFSGETQDALFESDMYISFTYRDPCPNVVVEAMAHGLPVIGVASGGMPDIVGNGGVLTTCDDFAEGFFSCHRFESDFPILDFEEILAAVISVRNGRVEFQRRVVQRFLDDLNIAVVASRYADVLRSQMDGDTERCVGVRDVCRRLIGRNG